MTQTIRWGILGPGAISRKFAKGLADLPDTELVAVGSRSLERAADFARDFGVRKQHPGYEALANDPEVDVVYIGTPHSFHKEHTLLCIAAGKAVLCEKPFAINFKEAEAMVAFARQQKLFLMEAMWTRFLPHVVKARELIAEGALGEVRMLQVDFGFRSEVNPKSRLFDPALGGGALLDVGIYPVSLAHMLFGKPAEISSFANLGSTGIDEEAAILFRHSEGQLSLLSTAVRLSTPHEALIVGTKGRLVMQASWWGPTSLVLHRQGHEPETLTPPCPINGYNYEALEVNACLREGRLESSIMPLTESLEIMQSLDSLRQQWGLRYPMEDGG
jgi:predicted dehydrogenase